MSRAMELNFWTGTEFEGGSYDEKERRWTVALRRADGSKRTMHPRHVVLATGVSGIPSLPDIPALKNFAGTVMHSSQYTDGEDWKGRKALVIGTGNSGHDIAQDLHSSGAEVTLVQRSSTLVTNIEPSAQLAYATLQRGPRLEDNDLIATSMPLPLAKRSHVMLTEQSKELDQELLDGLDARRLQARLTARTAPAGSSNISPAAAAIISTSAAPISSSSGKIGLMQFSDIESFVAEGARMRTARRLPPT